MTPLPTAALLRRVVLDEDLMPCDMAGVLDMKIYEIIRACNFYKIHRPPRALSCETLRNLTQAQGYTDGEIAIMFGYGIRAVTHLRRKYGIANACDRVRYDGDVMSVGDLVHERKAKQLVSDERLDELYDGRRYEDDPAAASPEGRWLGGAALMQSLTGCAAARCAE